MKYFSTFTGIGGFELGIEQAYDMLLTSKDNTKVRRVGNGSKRRRNIHNGHKLRQRPRCVGYSEIDKYAIQIYEKHFNHKNYGDITKINEKELPDFDLLVGGFPCQSFSIAGKRGGFSDTRGTMFFEIARIVREKQPRLLLLENVKGLLSHDKGRTFRTIISTLDELGYDTQWQVLNSKNHGVPQNRERVFIIGHLRGTPRPQVFPFTESNGEDNERRERKIRVINQQTRSKDRPSLKYSSGGSGTLCKDDEAFCIPTSGGSGQFIQQLNQPKHSNDRVYGTDGVSLTLNTMQGGRRQPFITDPQGRKNKVCKPQPHASTLRANTHGNEQVVNNIRRLTPLECERLQGFPDGWTEGVSDTQRYKTLGNAVTVNVVADIMEKLI